MFCQARDFREVYLHDPLADPGVAGIKAKFKKYLNHERFMLSLKGNLVTVCKEPLLEDPSDKALLQVKIPLSFKRALIVVFPGKTKEAAHRALVLDDSIESFPKGAVKCVNLSKNLMRLTLEGKSLKIKAGKTKVITNPPVNKTNHSSMYAHCFIGNEWHRVGAGLWPHPGNKRVYEFFYHDTESGRMKLKGFKDISPE